MDGRTFYLWRLKFTFVHYIFPLIPKKKVEVQTANIFVRGLPSVISYSSKLSSQSSSPMVSFETPAKRRSGGWIIFFSAYLRCVVLVVTESRSSKKKSRWYGVVVIAAVETKEEQHVVVALLLLLVHLLYASSFLGSSCRVEQECSVNTQGIISHSEKHPEAKISQERRLPTHTFFRQEARCMHILYSSFTYLGKAWAWLLVVVSEGEASRRAVL